MKNCMITLKQGLLIAGVTIIGSVILTGALSFVAIDVPYHDKYHEWLHSYKLLFK